MKAIDKAAFRIGKKGIVGLLKAAKGKDPVSKTAAHLLMAIDGGPGSGNWGHRGRPGLVGGSGKGGGKQYRGGRADIHYHSSKHDWLNGLKGEKQRETQKWIEEHKKDDKTGEQSIMENESPDALNDRQKLLDLMAESRSWNETAAALVDENLDKGDKAMIDALVGLYGGKDIGGTTVPDESNLKDWDADDLWWWQNTKSKAMGGPVIDKDAPKGLRKLGESEPEPEPEPEPKPTGRDMSWLDDYQRGSFKKLYTDYAKSAAGKNLSEDELGTFEAELFDNISYNPSEISFGSQHYYIHSSLEPYRYLIEKPHADDIYHMLDVKGGAFGWKTEDILDGKQTFDTLTSEENEQLRNLLQKYNRTTPSNIEKAAFSGFASYWTKPMATKEDTLLYFQLKDKALGGGPSMSREDYDAKRQSDIERRKENITPATLGTAQTKKGAPMTFEEADEGRANPNYLKAPEYRVNCQTCVVAYEARRRGYNVEAKGNTHTSDDPSTILSRRTRLAWIDPETGDAPEYADTSSVRSGAGFAKWCEMNIKPGERWHFSYSRKSSGHIVTISKNENGEIEIFDPQPGRIMATGKKAVAQYCSDNHIVYQKNGKSEIEMLRVDNLAFNLDFANKVLLPRTGN